MTLKVPIYKEKTVSEFISPLNVASLRNSFTSAY